MIFKKPKFTLDNDFLKDKLYEDSLLGFNVLKKSDITLNKKELTLFYPGAANDIIRPLLLLDALANFKQATIILADTHLNSNSVLEMMQNLTNIKKFKKKNNSLTFKFKNKEINFVFKECDILKSEIPEFDIYFERAFQLFRKDAKEFIPKIIAKANKDALLISDYLDFKDETLKKINFPKELNYIGFYKKSGVLRKL